MPARPQWLLRTPPIVEEIAALDLPVIDRAVIERTFGVCRRLSGRQHVSDRTPAPAGASGKDRFQRRVPLRGAAPGTADRSYVAPSLAQQLNITLGSLDEVFAQSDYITLHVGLTPQTQGMINAESIRKMKKGVRLINCARGELLNEPAVIEALQ